jgi:hypothetical protein
MAMTDAEAEQLTDRWQIAVAEDVRLRRASLAHSIAMKLAVEQYLNKRDTLWPSVERLARELRANRRSVQRAIARLMQCGHVERDGSGYRPSRESTR